MNLIRLFFFAATRLVSQTALKEATVKLDLLPDIDRLLMVGKGIGGRTCHGIH